jgi:hypothetical protein
LVRTIDSADPSPTALTGKVNAAVELFAGDVIVKIS